MRKDLVPIFQKTATCIELDMTDRRFTAGADPRFLIGMGSGCLVGPADDYFHTRGLSSGWDPVWVGSAGGKMKNSASCFVFAITPHPLATFFTAKYPSISSRVGHGSCPLAVPAADPIVRQLPRTPKPQHRGALRAAKHGNNNDSIFELILNGRFVLVRDNLAAF